jgi:hypothetical protein
MSAPTSPEGATRRDFLKTVAGTTAAAISLSPLLAQSAAQAQPAPAPANPAIPWYRRALRWGQTNIAEIDVDRYDIPWWRSQWKATRVQGIIVNAGGIVAYYPSKFPLHHRPPTLKDRDLFGDLTKAAHDDGIAVMARMDSSKAFEPLYRAHPEWFAIQANGQPYRSGQFYLSCINTPYYSEWLPGIMREIIERSHPDGFGDNIWSSTERSQICYCNNCKERFHAFAGSDLPQAHDWEDAAFRKWIDWSYSRRIEQWEFNNKVTQEAGGKDCLWVGMNGAGPSGQGNTFRDLKEICARAQMILLDSQSRSNETGFQQNAMEGKLVRSLLGPDKVMPESMSMYQHGRPQFRLSTKPPAEARLWMLSGIAGGIQPWWHHVNAYHEDRRMYHTAEPVMRWHEANQQYLINRKSIAPVAIGWSQRNHDFFGRDNVNDLVEQPFHGFVNALVRARIPYTPLHLDHLDRDAANLSVLILPNVGILTDEQTAAVRRFVARGGALIASGQTGFFDRMGDPRPDGGALADLLCVSRSGGIAPRAAAPAGRGRGGFGGAGSAASHTYLRLTPELRARVPGPHIPGEPPITGTRHPILAGFEETDILPFGGTLQPLTVSSAGTVLMTYIPSFPSSPPEIVIMATSHTDIPALVINESQPGRIAYLAADLDRRYAIDNFPDHANLLANIVRWATRDAIPLEVKGSGMIDCELYQQDNRLILHLVNLTSAGTWRAPVDELIPIGPLQVRVRLPQNRPATSARLLVAGNPLTPIAENNWARFDLTSILDHEVVVIET